MHKKLVAVFIVIALSMIAILYFQSEVISTTYRETARKFNSDADEALSAAVDRHEQQYMDSVVTLISRELSRPYNKVSISHEQWSDSLHIVIDDKDANLPSGSLNYIEVSYARVQVKLPILGQLGGKARLVNHNQEYEEILPVLIDEYNNDPRSYECKFLKADSLRLLSYFKDELRKRNINESFKLRSGCVERRLAVSLRDMVRKEGTIGLYVYSPQGFSKFTSEKKRWVRASFDNSENAVISRMRTALFFSILLTIIILGSFVFLLYTILKQRRLAELKDDFINNMTHELKTPIATVSAAIESMQSFNALQDADKTNRYLETSRKELLKLNTLVTKVLDMAGYEKNEIELMLSDVNVNELIKSIIAVDRLYLNKNVNFDFKNTANIDYIKADPVHFRSALENLVDNAIKYSEDPVEIVITCYQDDLYLYFSVKDNGIGIPAADRKRVFDKFHRVTTGNVHNVKGTGLGLSYVKYVVEAHGGTVALKSEVGKGSEFIISVPIRSWKR